MAVVHSFSARGQLDGQEQTQNFLQYDFWREIRPFHVGIDDQLITRGWTVQSLSEK